MISPVGVDTAMTLLHPLGRLWEKEESCWMLKMRPHKSHPAFTPPCHLYRTCLDRTQLCQLFSNLECWLSCLHFTSAWPCTHQYSLNLLDLLSPPALILRGFVFDAETLLQEVSIGAPVVEKVWPTPWKHCLWSCKVNNKFNEGLQIANLKAETTWRHFVKSLHNEVKSWVHHTVNDSWLYQSHGKTLHFSEVILGWKHLRHSLSRSRCA